MRKLLCLPAAHTHSPHRYPFRPPLRSSPPYLPPDQPFLSLLFACSTVMQENSNFSFPCPFFPTVRCSFTLFPYVHNHPRLLRPPTPPPDRNCPASFLLLRSFDPIFCFPLQIPQSSPNAQVAPAFASCLRSYVWPDFRSTRIFY